MLLQRIENGQILTMMMKNDMADVTLTGEENADHLIKERNQ